MLLDANETIIDDRAGSNTLEFVGQNAKSTQMGIRFDVTVNKTTGEYTIGSDLRFVKPKEDDVMLSDSLLKGVRLKDFNTNKNSNTTIKTIDGKYFSSSCIDSIARDIADWLMTTDYSSTTEIHAGLGFPTGSYVSYMDTLISKYNQVQWQNTNQNI